MNAQVRKFTAKRIFLLLEILSQVFAKLDIHRVVIYDSVYIEFGNEA